MSIRVKIAAILGAVFGGLLLLNAAAVVFTLGPSFDDLERQGIETDLRRAEAVLASELAELGRYNVDWAAWDDSYAFVADRNPAFMANNLVPEGFANAQIDFMAYVDRAGGMVWAYDRAHEAGSPPAIAGMAEGRIAADHPLLRHPHERSAIEGLLNASGGPMLVASRPIVTSRMAGPIRGTLIVGRRFAGALLDDFLRQVQLDVAFSTVAPGATSPGGAAVHVELDRSADLIRAHRTLADVAGTPFLALAIERPRDIVRRGREAVRWTIGFMIVAGVSILATALFLVQRFVMRPLSQLHGHLTTVAETGDLQLPLPVVDSREVGSIAREVRVLQERIARIAHIDDLTGLPNRMLFNDRARQVLRLARREGRRAAVLFLDLDNFKAINDEGGHAAGDELLRAMASRLQHHLRECDTISRIGGDEFAIVAGGMTEPCEVTALGNKVLGLFAEPFSVGGRTVEVTPSLGISVFPDDGEDIETLLRNADSAMYRAKRAGKNAFRLFALDTPAA